MKITSLLTATAGCLWLALTASGAESSGFAAISVADAQREVSALEQQGTTAAMWIWTDRYVYQPGETLTLRWTVKPNNDLYPYTTFVYRQNNQTGAKTFLPGNSSTPVDITGASAAAGYRISRLPSVTKGVLVGTGGSVVSSALSIPSELGMHTAVVELRDYTGTRIIKSSYFKFGVVDGTETLSGELTTAKTLVRTKAYRISGVYRIKGTTLTIESGTIIQGEPGSQPAPSALLIARTATLIANGTRSRPIIMTSSRPFGQRAPSDWGGLVLLGRARINQTGGEAPIEGLPDDNDFRYGGTDDNHNCGVLRYVRVEFAGIVLAANNELNSFTWGGCGRATVSEYLQSHYGQDDAFEWFGGSNDGKYLLATFFRDDGIDWQNGWTGRVQHAAVLQDPSILSNKGIEADNWDANLSATPISNPTLYNITLIGTGVAAADEANSAFCVHMRRNTAGSTNNTICQNWGNAALRLQDIDLARTSPQFSMNGMLIWNNNRIPNGAATITGQMAGDATAVAFAEGTQGQGRNFVVADPKLRSPLELSNPDFRPGFGSPALGPNWVQPPDDGFFDQWAKWIGAFGEVDWTEEWTMTILEADMVP